MGELAILILALTQALIIGAILFFLFFKERRQENFFIDVTNDSRVATAEERAAFLKHISLLEKMSIDKGKPRMDIDEDQIRDILMRGPEKAENEIFKDSDDGSIEINESNFKDIPFGPNTNVMIEGDQPTIVEEDG